MDEESPRALYLFCFTRANADPQLAAREQLFVHRWGELSAICGWTAIQQWSGPQAERRMHDLEWLAPQALRHQAVIESAMQVSPVLPARLGTLFSSVSVLERFVAAHYRPISDFLIEMENKQEWSVKVFLDRGRAGSWLAAHGGYHNGGGAAPGSGANYLRERQARGAAAREINGWAARTLEPIVEEMGRRAARSCPRAVSAQSTPERQMILNLAFLVGRENLDGFRDSVEGGARLYQAQGLDLEMSGPWPPYSFCPALEMPQ
jgi:hypothetical protein